MEVIAFVLLVVELGKEHDVSERLKKMENVTEVHEVYGDYDIILKIEAPDIKSLDNILTKIRLTEGVVRTITLISA